jgi:hypothetical protein
MDSEIQHSIFRIRPPRVLYFGFHAFCNDFEDMDAGKVFHPKLQACYEDYLKTHRPVLVSNLGPMAKFDRTFTDADFGSGASRCFTLFPGFWPRNRTSAFTTATFKRAFGPRGLERAVRRALIEALHPEVIKAGENPGLVAANLHHGRKIEEDAYFRSQRIAGYKWVESNRKWF